MYLDYREKFELFIVSERDSKVRKTYLEKNMCTAHNFVRLSLLRSVALQRLSSGDRVGEVRKTYLAQKTIEVRKMYLDYREKFELFIRSEKDREVRKPYLDYGEVCVIYLERERPRGTENVPQKICVQHIILPVLVY